MPLASEAELVFSTLGYFVVLGVLFGLSGLGGIAIEIPNTSTGSTTEDPGAHVDCGFLFQWFCDLGSFTIHATQVIGDLLGYVGAFVFFFFQLLTFQLPIPVWLNTLIVIPPAIMLVYIGIRFVRGGG